MRVSPPPSRTRSFRQERGRIHFVRRCHEHVFTPITSHEHGTQFFPFYPSSLILYPLQIRVIQLECLKFYGLGWGPSLITSTCFVRVTNTAVLRFTITCHEQRVQLLSFCPYPLDSNDGDYGGGKSVSSFILLPLSLLSEIRARLFAFFQLSALIIHPCLNAPESPKVSVIPFRSASRKE